MLSDNEEVRDYYNIFAKYEIKHDRFTISAGLNLNNTEYELTDLFNQDSTNVSGNFSFPTQLSPQIGMLYKLKGENAIYGTISRGFSPPTLEQTLTPDGQINTDLRPEQGWNFEIGSRSQGYKKFSYDIALFSLRINDLLVAKRIAEDQSIGINAGRTVHNGLELFTSYKWINNGSHLFFSDLTYTYSRFRFEEFIDGDNDFSGNKLTGTPANTVNFVLHYIYKKSFYANLNYRFVDQMPIRDDNSIFSEAFNVVDLKVGYKGIFKRALGGFSLDVHSGVNNLFDEKYASQLWINAGSFGGNAPRFFYPGLPINWYGGIKVRYGF